MGYRHRKDRAEVEARTAQEVLADKILAVYHHKQHWQWGGYLTSTIHLTEDVLFNLWIAAKNGMLSPAVANYFSDLPRAEIFPVVYKEADMAYRENRKLLGAKMSHHFTYRFLEGEKNRPLLREAYRLTRLQVTEKFGASDWNLKDEQPAQGLTDLESGDVFARRRAILALSQ